MVLFGLKTSRTSVYGRIATKYRALYSCYIDIDIFPKGRSMKRSCSTNLIESMNHGHHGITMNVLTWS